MKLLGIDCQIPSNRISNHDVIELVKYHSSSSCKDLVSLEKFTRKFLSITGIESRFWREKKERPIELVKKAAINALQMANMVTGDIDLVIYSSIDRGFIEPANAAFICNALEMSNVRSFDVVDACMGWASAVQVAESFLNSSDMESVMVINAEFPMDEKGCVLPENFTIKNDKELHWKAASFTLGEGASVCIFKKSESRILFEFIEDNSNANLCRIELPNSEKYSIFSSEENVDGILQFYANGSSLLDNGMSPATTVLQNLLRKLDYKPALIFPHSVSNKIIQDAALSVGVESLIYSTFSKLGNLATVSIPSSITKALYKGVLKKGQRCTAWIASAGMKYSAFEIQL